MWMGGAKIQTITYGNQAPADISVQIENDELSTVFRTFYQTARLLKGVSPLSSLKR